MKLKFLKSLGIPAKIALSALSFSLLMTPTANSFALDVKLDGEYDFTYQIDNLGFEGKSYNHAQQRIRLGIEVAVNENLSGYFQTQTRWEWGTNIRPGTEEKYFPAFDGPFTRVYMRLGYIDWKIPSTDITVRMGRHKYSLPAYASCSAHLQDVIADGILIAAPINDTFTINAFWGRLAHFFPENKAASTGDTKKFDIYGLVGTGKFENITASVWSLYGSKAKSIDPTESGQSAITNIDSKGDIITAGFGLEWTPVDPLTISADFAYGRANFTHAADQKGWYAIGKIAYSLDFGTPAIRAWYSTGDDKGKYNLGQFPSIFGDLDLTNSYYDGMDGLGLGNGPYNCVFTGSWGVSLLFEDITFIKDLHHLVSATYMNGTNNKYNTEETDPFDYMTTRDHAFEFDFLTSYKLYKNLSLSFEVGYIVQNFDTSEKYGRGNQEFDDAFKTALNFHYTF